MAFSAEYVSKGPWVKLKPLRNAEQRLLAVSGGQKKMGTAMLRPYNGNARKANEGGVDLPLHFNRVLS
jgi:hypothetical protein